MNCLVTRAVRRGAKKVPAKPKSRKRKIKSSGILVDLSQLLTEELTKTQVKDLQQLLSPAWINVLCAKCGRRWRVKLTSVRTRLHA